MKGIKSATHPAWGVASWVALMIALAGLTTCLVFLLLSLKPGFIPSGLERLKLAGAIVAGLVGTAATTVAVRKQQLAERESSERSRSEFHAQLAEATDSLSKDNLISRLAAVKSIASLSDAQTGHDASRRRQVCLDVLLAYLRQPLCWDVLNAYDENIAADKYIYEETHGVSDDRWGTHRETLDDRLVREDICACIAERTRVGGCESWTNLTIDLTQAVLFSTDWTDCIFRSSVRMDSVLLIHRGVFRGTRWTRDVSWRWGDLARSDFADAVFDATNQWQDCKFKAGASFKGASFAVPPTFDDATFNGTMDFSHSTGIADVAAFNGVALGYSAKLILPPVLEEADVREIMGRRESTAAIVESTRNSA